MSEKIASINDAILKGKHYYDLLLAIVIVGILSLMILPIPTLLLDVLLAANLAFSMLLLMLSLYVPSILAFSSFPSLLLITTLFRLSLNITTTRMILLEADAGEIIYTFGNFVVGGTFVVGVVIFLIITIIQFVVITKGAERVAEVAARFTLDAMPGKQMSIDADLRAGAITQQEATERREIVSKENQLHGAMDGAMKFVKGDAIAGLIITAINITAGVLIGVLQKGWDIGKAITTYAILTIGDGLISQIPALLISITAGMIVTRVSSGNGGALGGDIGSQLLAQPKALMISSAFMIGFALVPGFPVAPFMLLAILAGGVGFVLHRGGKFRSAQEEVLDVSDKRSLPAMAPAGAKKAPRPRGDSDEFSVTVPLLLDVSEDSQEMIDPQSMNDELIRVRRALYNDLGVPFPGIHLRFNQALPTGQYKVLLHEVPVAEGLLKKGHVLAREKVDSLQMLNLPYTEDKTFIRNVPAIWVDESRREDLQKAKISYLEPTQVLTYHLTVILKRYAGDFVGLQETKYLLEQMEKEFPELVREAQRVLPIQKITEIFQRLVQEDVSIRNLRTILQSLIEWGQKEKEAVLLTEYVRSALKRFISYKFSRGQNILAVYLLDEGLEESIRKAVRQTSAGAYLALEPRTVKAFLESVRREVGNLSESNQKPVLLTSLDVRRYTRKLIEQEFPELPVLSHQELTEEITIQPLGRIRI